MFEFLFKYPAAVFSRGTLVLLGSWPRWILFAGIAAAAALLAIAIWRKRTRLAPPMHGARIAALWGLQTALVAVLMLLLWEPAISITALKPQQNIVAVVMDDSRSMALTDTGATRQQQALKVLDAGLLKSLQSRFQVRFYRLTAGVERIQDVHSLCAMGSATQIGKGLRQLADEAATLPIGAVVLLSDGADNAGGVDFETLSEIRRRRLPVNTIGFGREQLTDDIELDGFDVPAKALADSRLQAQVTIRQNGFGGKHARLVLTGGGAVLASRDVVLNEGPEQVETVEFNAGKAGVKSVEARLDPLPGEKNADNNRLTRVVSLDNTPRRILYVEGEPRWEYKFLRRAVEDDPALHVVSMLRTTQNKIYRQGIANAEELAEGFPNKPEELFEFQGLILGSVEAGFFTATQQQMIKDFVDRRGGGLLFLGGRWALADGGYNAPPLAELLPVTLPQRKVTFERTMVAAELTDAGKQSLICRIEDDPEKSIQHWEVLPYLANYQDPGTAKPGAVVLARVNAGGNHLPLLITENYGRGRTAVFATGGSWRWRMQQPVGDISQETFWRQLLRWTAGSSPSRVVASTPNSQLEDDGRIQLRAEVRDKTYLPASDAEVQANVIGPDGSSEFVALRPEPLTQGVYSAEWNAAKPGSYLAEVSATRGTQSLGKDVLTFRREDGVAENFHREQNKELLSKLAEDTGGRYYTATNAAQLAQEISYSEAGITGRETKELWNMPAILILLLAIRAAEWLLRRRWGFV
ncbi:MAG TPA: glutamine amidotransferase [Bryobacteraceae bacterium]|nr:glutamine amidotransferase [Bryobacteraceae bacterium]